MLYQTQNPHGGDIYGRPVRLDFSANTNPYGTPLGVLEAVSSALPMMHRYPDPYCRTLIRAISEFENVPPEFILCGSGAAELIYSYGEALRPKTAVELAPTFSEYSLALERVGCRMERFLLTQKDGFVLSEAFFRFLEEKKPKAVFLCNPNNPTGRIIDAGLLKEILHFCRKYSMRLFLDECFLDLTERGESLKASLADHPQLLILKAFTKSYGMAGIRLGYCMSADKDLLCRMSKTVQPWNVSVLAQAAGIAALKEQAFLQKARETISKERKWMASELERLGLWVCPSDANYLLFLGPEKLHDALIQQGIAIRNCDNYPGLSAGWYRTAVRLHEENEQLILAIKYICEAS